MRSVDWKNDKESLRAWHVILSIGLTYLQGCYFAKILKR
jgi:hypothetical protein